MLLQLLIVVSIVLGVIIYYLYVIAPKLNPVNKAELYEKQGMYEDAIFEYKKALDDKPDDFVIHYKLANLYLNRDEEDQAAIHFEEIINIDKYNYEVEKLDVQKKLSQIYYNRDDVEMAFQTFMDILKLYPGDSDALYHVAFISLGQEEFEIAQKYFDRLAKFNQDDFDIQFGAGICSYQNLKTNDAVEYFTRAVSLKPNSEIANLAIAFTLLRKKDFKQAIDYLNKLLKSPVDFEVKFITQRLNGFISTQLKHYDEAINFFQGALELARSKERPDEEKLALYDLGFGCISAERTRHAYDFWNDLYQLDKSYKNIDNLITHLRREMDVDIKYDRDEFAESVVDLVDDWIVEAFPANFLWDICGLKSDYYLDIKNIMVTTRVLSSKDKSDTIVSSSDFSDKIEKFCDLDSENFRIIANRAVSKLGYKVDQILQTYREADGVDFLAYSKANKDMTLVWVRRWKKTKVSDIPLRNFAQAINDYKAKGGLFLTTADLTPSAEKSLQHLSKITVIYPNELGKTLSGLI